MNKTEKKEALAVTDAINILGIVVQMIRIALSEYGGCIVVFSLLLGSIGRYVEGDVLRVASVGKKLAVVIAAGIDQDTWYPTINEFV